MQYTPEFSQSSFDTVREASDRQYGDLSTPRLAGWSNPQTPRKSALARAIMKEQEDWHSMYILQHNWHAGNCSITNLQVTPSTKQEQAPACNPRALRLAPGSSAPRSNPVMIFTKDYILSSAAVPFYRNVPEINIFRIENRAMVGTLRSSKLSQAQLRNPVTMTSLRLDDSSLRIGESTAIRVVAGYDIGGFSVWSFQTIEYGDESVRWTSEELCTVLPTSGKSLLSIAVLHDYVATCSSDFNVKVYRLQAPVESGYSWTCTQIHSLHGNACWAPIDLYLQQRTSADEYTLYISYAAPTFDGEWDVGVQELQLCPNDGKTSTKNYTPISQTPKARSPLTCIRFRYPYLVTAHADNTIQVYKFVHMPTVKQPQRNILVYCSTLFAHAAAVTALELDGISGKLITGGVDGIKIWELGAGGIEIPEDPIVTLMDKEWASEWDRGTAVSVSGRGPRWLGFDEGRIFSVSGGWWVESGSGESREVSCAAERITNEGDGAVGVIKIFSFFDE